MQTKTGLKLWVSSAVLALTLAMAGQAMAADNDAGDYPMGPGMMGGYGMGPGMMGGYGPGYGAGTRGGYGGGYGYGMGPGMMGGYGYGMGPGMMGGYGYGMGPGMMGGYGYGMGPGMMGGYGYGPGMMQGYGYGGPQLDLSDKQRKEIDGIVEKEHKAQWERMGRLQQEYQKMGELYRGEKWDADAIGKAQAQVDKLRREMMESRIRTHNQIMDVLTKEQRQKLSAPWQRK